jgi:uncharacterized membrane protein YgdD (TMEM256/DUF423 family)
MEREAVMTGGVWLFLGSVFAGLAVATGAFGAHGLKDRLAASEMLDAYHTAVQYQMYHALGLLAVGLMAQRSTGVCAQVAGWSFLVGILLFSGSLYALTLSGVKALGAITPFGGVAFLVGWVALAIAALRSSTGAPG